MVVLHALGQCLIRTAITTITPRADMCFALASYLTRERGNRIPRRRIERLFWPRMHAADASHSLSELIHKLRRKGVAIHRDEASCIWLPREAAAIDIDTLGDEPAEAIAARDLSVLPGYEPRASPAFNDWVDEWRAQMRFRVLDDVVAAIQAPAADGDWQLALRLADQALRIDPDNETALQARARAAAALTTRNRVPDPRPRSLSVSPPDSAVLRENSLPPTWHPRPARASHSDTSLVGRDKPMTRLVEQATRALKGDVCSAYICGATGVGKSRVVRELSAWMHANGAAICAISCGRHDVHRPLSAFVQAIPRLLALPGAVGCAPSTLSCLKRVTQLSTDGADVAAHDSLHLASAIRTSLIDLVDAIADEQPLLLVVEDVHWIDPASWSLLRAIAGAAHHSTSVVCTSRIRWQHTAWGESDDFLIEELGPLDAAAARGHMSNYLGKLQRTADDQFIDWCVETSGGNPYFIEELADYWIATGEQYSAPPSLLALVEARLAHLSPEALRVIQAAAILGRNSTIALLQHVLELPTHALFSAVEELNEAGLLTVTEPIEESRCAPILCRHDLVMRAAARGLSVQSRAFLHHAAARAIEWDASGAISAERLWDCADHWQAAGQTERSIEAALACAHHLHEMGFAKEAVKRCKAALERCQSKSSRLAVLSAMSKCVSPGSKLFRETIVQVRALEAAPK